MASRTCLIETVFDTLNAKAAIYADRSELERKARLANDGVRHDHGCQRPDAVGSDARSVLDPIVTRAPSRRLNCALGAKQLRPTSRSWRARRTCVGTYPNAGLPNAFGGYDDNAAHMAGMIGEFAASGSLNLVGGCCGTTPEHIACHRAAVAVRPPRAIPNLTADVAAVGTRADEVDEEIPFVNVGERTNVTGSREVSQTDRSDDYEARSTSHGTRSTTARRSSTSTWTKACSTPKRR